MGLSKTIRRAHGAVVRVNFVSTAVIGGILCVHVVVGIYYLHFKDVPARCNLFKLTAAAAAADLLCTPQPLRTRHNIIM